MAEIDTKSIESVQAALSLFGEKSDHRNSRCSSPDKELANLRVHLETKDYACKQALLTLDQYQKMADELLTQLTCYELEKEIYMNECIEARLHLDELESRIKEMAGQLSESAKIQEQHLHVTSELRATRRQLLSLEGELATSRDEKLESLTQAELIETALSIEKVKMEELLRHVAQLHETIMHLKLAAEEPNKEKMAVCCEKVPEVQLPATAVAEMQEQLLCVREQLDMVHNLEDQLLKKSEFIYSLQLELHQANELHSSSQKAASDAICQLNQLKADLQLQERKYLDQAGYVNILETEFKQLKQEVIEAKEASRLNISAEQMKTEFDKTRSELVEIRAKENEAQVEIALLKCELHKGRSKMAAAEAAETRFQSEKSALHLALQQLAIEANEAKRENQLLIEASKVAQDSQGSFLQNPPQEISIPFENVPNIDETKIEPGKDGDTDVANIDETKMEPGKDGDTDSHIMISREEYGFLLRKAQQADKCLDPVHESKHELHILKKELEIATAKVSEFRTRAEQAISRAEAAEKAKTALEEQKKKRREQKERRKAALAALREESISREINSINYDNAPKIYQPLGKVLNIKF